MRLVLAPLLAAALLLPATASAATFGEAAPTTVRGWEPECAQPTGGPAELIASTSDGVKLLQGTRDGFQPTRFAFDRQDSGCAVAASAPSGAGVVACCVSEPLPAAAVREPGGSWSEPVALSEGGYVVGLAAAVSERGEALVAFIDGDRRDDLAVSVVRRPPGGAWTEPQRIGPAAVGTLSAGVAANGDAVVLFTAPERDRVPRRNTIDVMVATSSAGAGFSAPVRLTELPRLSEPSLAVAPDGHALVAFSDGKTVQAAERAPGGSFGPPTRVADARDPAAARTSTALGADGRAAIAWGGIALGGVTVISRAGPGAFSSPTVLAAQDRAMAYDLYINTLGATLPLPLGAWGFDSADPRVALAPDGRVLVGWAGPRTVGGVDHRAATLATLSLDGAVATTQTLGGETAYIESVHPAILADGTPALVWADSEQDRAFKVHLAADGATPSDQPFPRVEIGSPVKRVLGVYDELKVPISCSAPCAVRGAVVGQSLSESSMSLAKRGKGTLELGGHGEESVAPERPGRVRVRITYGTLDGTRTRSRTFSIRLARERERRAPVGRVSRPTVVRRGNTLRVSWTVTPAIDDGLYSITGSTSRSRFAEPAVVERFEDQDGEDAFSVTLKPATGIRWVSLYAFGARPLKQTVKVR